MPVAYLGLGSNLDAGQNLQLASRELRSRFSQLKMSRVYCNEALGFDGADFLNAVACIETRLTPQPLCEELELIHNLAERTRRSEKFISRSLDIDLLLYEQLILNEPPIRLPREDVLKYSNRCVSASPARFAARKMSVF